MSVFKTEAELCAAFCDRLRASKRWTVYPETCDWDILLVRNRDGFQIGIEAKLRLNAKVLDQAIPSWRSWTADDAAPDCRAVLVPADSPQTLTRLCGFIGVTVLTCSLNGRFSPDLPDKARLWGPDDNWIEWAPARRLELPEYVPDVVAGRPAPAKLTPWKIAAIKISVLCDRHGFVRPFDFRALGLSMTRFTQPVGYRWLVPGERRGEWVKSDLFPDLRAQHPEVYPQIEADYPTWSKELESAPGVMALPERAAT